MTAALLATEATSLAQAPATPAYTYRYAQPAQVAYRQPATTYTYSSNYGYTYTQPAQGYTYAQQPTYTYAQQQPAATQATYTYAQPAQAQATGGDAYGFLNWLNATRAQYGLSAVGWDENLSSWAAANSAQQASRGLGHFVMGPARRQNSAMGNSASIGSMWMNSPAHRAALLDPSIRFIGLAGAGAYWTFNAY